MTNSPDHFHVVAVQDWGGSQEYWRGWDDKWTREEAEAHAGDMLIADRLVNELGEHDLARHVFGDRLHKLEPTNAGHLGWDAIWVEPCEPDCNWTVDEEPVTDPFLPSAKPCPLPFNRRIPAQPVRTPVT